MMILFRWRRHCGPPLQPLPIDADGRSGRRDGGGALELVVNWSDGRRRRRRRRRRSRRRRRRM
jgi:hypothetical protein